MNTGLMFLEITNQLHCAIEVTAELLKTSFIRIQVGSKHPVHDFRVGLWSPSETAVANGCTSQPSRTDRVRQAKSHSSATRQFVG
jgi:hypothetical protein